MDSRIQSFLDHAHNVCAAANRAVNETRRQADQAKAKLALASLGVVIRTGSRPEQTTAEEILKSLGTPVVHLDGNSGPPPTYESAVSILAETASIVAAT